MTDFSAPLVSVIIPTYNGEKYLEEAIASVFGQTYPHYELIVVDDGSATDAVRRICSKHQDQLTYLRQSNRGLSSARNAGIRQSRGVYAAFLDDDDVWLPDKLRRQVELYEDLHSRGIEAGLVYTGAYECAEDGVRRYGHLWKSAGRCYEALLRVDFVAYGGSSVMAKIDVLNEVGLFDENLRCSEDYDLWLRIAQRYPIYSVNEFLINFRNKKNSLSKDPRSMIEAGGRVLEKHLKGTEFDRGDTPKRSLILKSHARHDALRWKNAAYECLFENQDGKTFREYIANGRALDTRLFGLKVGVYWLISLISPHLCQKIRGLKRQRHRDVVMDVEGMRNV